MMTDAYQLADSFSFEMTYSGYHQLLDIFEVICKIFELDHETHLFSDGGCADTSR